MEKLKVRINFRSGRVAELESNEYYKGQFRQWIERNFTKSNGDVYEFITFDDFFVNIKEIEKLEEIV